MKSILFAFAAMLLYGISSLVIEQKFERYNTIVLTFLFTLPFIPLALLFLGGEKAMGERIIFPHGNYFWLIMAMGVLYFFADYFFVGAFTAGGNVLTILTIMMLSPVVAVVAKYLWVGGVPNVYQVVGYVFAACAVLLLARGAAL